ncbi:hypothetical protein AB0J52_29995, partial [Spirillospora sp. NPDC049652]
MSERDERDQGGPPGRWRRPDASMSLLADLFEGRLADPGYAEAAARPLAGARPRRGPQLDRPP